MSFFAPSAAWLFLLALPLIALYFLKLKRPRVAVPSLVLWRRVLDDQRVNSPFQRFKRNLLLFLQLLLLFLLVLAAMQPFFRGKDDRVRRLPVLIDCSASMAAAATRGGESRLELAKERVETLIAGLMPDQEMAILSFAEQARQRCGFTRNRQILRDALAEIAIEEVASGIEDAFRMAQALGRGTAFEEVLLFTDGNVPGRAELDLPFRVNYQKLESPGPNIGITACSARRGREDGWEIFLEVGASHAVDYGGALTMGTVQSEAGATLASELVTTQSGRTTRLLFTASGYEAQDLVFRLIPNTNFDALESDNVAYLSLPALRPLQVYVPETLRAFWHALRSLDKVEVYPNARNVAPEAFDLVVADDEVGAALPARVRLLLAMVPRDLQALVRIESPASHQAIDWRRDSLLWQYVDLSNVVFLDEPVADNVPEGTFLNLGYEILLSGARGPLLLRQTAEKQLSYHALFHVDRSTFPYRVGFPVFVSNLVQQTRQLAGLAEASALSTGILPGLSVAPNLSVRVIGPAGPLAQVESDAAGNLPGVAARTVGLYRYEGLDRVRGASLLSLAETTLKPVEAVEFREARVTVQKAPFAADRPVWRWLAAAALLILLLEWWVFQRRPGGGTPSGRVSPLDKRKAGD